MDCSLSPELSFLERAGDAAKEDTTETELDTSAPSMYSATDEFCTVAYISAGCLVITKAKMENDVRMKS